jgi:DNA polymerase III subunit alpha
VEEVVDRSRREAGTVGSSFTHLHTHTEFSMLDGAARVGEVIAKAAADGQPALGITDHGNMYGVLDFYAECRKQGITPVVGSELYMAGESRHERPRRRGKVDDTGGDSDGGQKLYYHLTALAETDTGYRNLLKLSSRAYLEGYFYKPRVDWELLEEYHEGIIATTGCLGGVVLQALLQGDMKAATERAARLQDIFGRDALFVEIQDHGLAAQHKTNPQLIEIARRIKAPLLATNDSHYTHREDHVAHDALLCVQTGSMIDDPNRFKFEGDQHYLKTAAEMRDLFREVPEACDNTLWIAERADVTIEFGKPKLPNFEIPQDFLDSMPKQVPSAAGTVTHDCGGLLVVEEATEQAVAAEDPDTAYLRHLTYEGARKRWGDALPDKIRERLDYELGVISQMGFSSYFLITWDLIDHARRSGIRVGPGRGSAAGCAVAYCLWITDLDPIKYDLLFERFLNPSRVSMPDIDMDFDSRYRDEMIRYAAERYGRDHVAQIVTFSTIKARAAVRDAARVLGYPYVVGDKVAKAMPPLVMGRDTPLHACMEEHPKYVDGYKAARELREMYESDPDCKKVIDVAKGLEGLRRQDGIHAAAVVITDEPLTEYLPIQRKPEAGKDPEDAPVVTQYEMHGVEDLGLLKMDFLGLRNLDVISDTLDLIEKTTGVQLDIDEVPLDDDPTLALLREGKSIGVFQLEGGPMRALMRSLAPTSFDDVAALVALYRPGPMAANMHNDYADRKNGRKPITYLHPDLEEILGDTQGLMIYQESVMRVAQKFAGYSLAEADNLRKACGKKIRELIAKERVKFVEGCETTGYGAEIGTALFDIIEPFADYAFNKSHSYGYGYVAYQTAYLKAHHPVEYFAALLTSVKADQDKSAVYLNECRQMGIPVLVPDVNVSDSDFTARIDDKGQGTIPFGLSAVRNVGEGLVALIIAEREENGPFVDFYDFCERVDPQVLNKRTVESLVKAGAFDCVGHPRKGLLQVFDQIVDRTLARRREREQGVMSLFGDLGDSDAAAPTFDEKVAIPAVEFDKMERLAFEKEMLGLYVSDHPLMGAEHVLKRRTDCSITELREGGGGPVAYQPSEDGRGGAFRSVGGVVTNLQRKWTKKGDLMAIFVLEDLQAAIEVMVFPKTMAECGAQLTEDAVVCVKGRIDSRDDIPKMIATEIQPIELIGDGGPPLRLAVPPTVLDERRVDQLRRLLVEHPGDSPVFLHVGRQVLRLPPAFNVDTGNGLAGELRELLGAEALL